MKPPKKCDLCGTFHHDYQAHVFPATNNESNAINSPSVQPRRPAGALQPYIPPAAGVKELDSSGRTANRRTREDYNAYQREYMRKRRARGKET